MEQRLLGETGAMLSVVGFGGLVLKGTTRSEAERLVGDAVERGVNYFDVAPSYGEAEERLGPALQPFREKSFLACKTTERTAHGARVELERSLRRLRTDRVDLYQLHGVTSLEQARTILGPGGALEAFVAAREAGLVRYIGFSAHGEDAALLLLRQFRFDSMLFPINFACWLGAGFGRAAVAEARARGTGVLALKALARRPWQTEESRRWPKCWYEPIDDPSAVALALRFTLSGPVTAAVSPGHAELLQLACDAARELSPLAAEEQEGLVRRLGGVPIFRPPADSGSPALKSDREENGR